MRFTAAFNDREVKREYNETCEGSELPVSTQKASINQQIFICSKQTLETLGKDVKYVPS